ncbi:MAG: TonB-dependent receptor [Dysgonamonadaceae bacterium]|jgi:iron complex outermembrane receptor protein|nr:TonB-dependent receptor [Dysgonamonadaceae bacterium]
MKKVFLFLTAAVWPLFSLFSQEKNNDSIKFRQLQEVEIMSVRANDKTPVAYSNMTKQDIETRNFGQDIPFLITQTPSVLTTSDAGTGIGYTGFRVRGTDANRINITANGVPLNDSESHGVFWVNMPDFASSLQDLQVQRGVGTSTNGAGAFGASINMKTENIPQKAYSELNTGFGSLNTAKATFKVGSGTVGKHFAFDARLSSITSDGFIDRASVDLKSYFAQGAYFAGNTLIKLITFGGTEKTYHAWDGVPQEELEKGNRTYNSSGYMGDDENGHPLYYKDQTDNYRQTHYQLSLLQQLPLNFKWNVALHYTRGDGYYEEYKSARKLIEYGLKPLVDPEGNSITKSDLVRQKHLANDFYGGIFSLDYNKEKWTVSLGGGANYYDGNHFGWVKWVQNYAFDSSFAPNHEYYRGTGQKTDATIYLKANYQLLNQLNLYGDWQYRFIDYQIKGKNDTWDWINNEMQRLNVNEQFRFFNPKAGLFYQMTVQNSVYASFAVAHREPNRNNYTDASFNEAPKPERLFDYELGYKFNNKRFEAGLNLYYMRYKDQLVLTGKVNDIGEPLTSNVPDSYRAGAELTAAAKITSWLDWNGHLTLSENKIHHFTEYVEDWETGNFEAGYLGTTPIAYAPNIIAGSLFTAHYKAFAIGLQSNYAGKQYMDNSGSESRKINAYFVNNLRCAYTFYPGNPKSIELACSVNNLLNEKYESNGYVWYTWYEGSGDNRKRGNDLRYFPQAGTTVLIHLAVKF